MAELTEASLEAMLIKLRKHMDETGGEGHLNTNSFYFSTIRLGGAWTHCG